ncbi:oligosaccharide flippase family protein [Marinobacter sp. DSM 26671]|uniref:oligosaccharide flippase family protein n=1 Tax=Marinobacter sp. DSM 26671 TaxID=1761793 RepID=UPI000B88E95B|nr:oligosaccharide flippase family protein [Marinobacter sp. DSM 26671]
MIKVVKSSGLLVLQRLAQRSLGIVSTIVLARILTPEDFGIVAIAMLVMWFSEAISKSGAEAYVIQKADLTTEDVNSAWTLDILLKSLSFIILLAAAPITAWLKDDSSLILVVIVTGTVIIFDSLNNPGMLILKREQNYGRIVKFSVFAKVFAISISIPIAIIFKNHWALISGLLASSIFMFIASFYISSFRPKLSLQNVGEQWQFSKWIIPRSSLGYFRNHVDSLIVGSSFSTGQLGAYNNMKYFASIPSLQFISPILAPLHAEYGKVQNLKTELRFQSDITIKIIAVLVAPIASVAFIGAESIISIVLGSQWLQFSYLFAYFGLLVVPFAIMNQSIKLLMVDRRTKNIFFYELLASAATFIVLLVFSNWSLLAFVVARCATELVLCIGLYIYAYGAVLGSSGLKNIILTLLNVGGSIVVLGFLADLYLGEIGPVTRIFGLLFFGSLNVVLSAFCFYFFLMTDREKKLFIKTVKQMRK